ncbi:hypothetical protein [Hyalangium versicolor]|uniref:hypothetical protein n=1 Tax=Hyalangium versicolor TaxID=2861190 RepID=UPI001CCBDDED|nr:hypothetical protein [Hyalangium versicolor]
MKTLRKSMAWLGLCLVVTGCQVPSARGRRGLSASEPLGAFAQQGSSDSGNSSDGSGSDSGSDSGNSADSSNESGDSSKESSDNSNNSSEDSNHSSDNSSDDSSNNSSDSSDSSRSSQKNPMLSATVIALTAAGLGAVFWQAAARAMRVPPKAAPPPPAQEVAPAAETYLRSRMHQLREDLALGVGPTVEELAALARIRRENLGSFGRLLRAHRQELLALADVRTLTPERALAWLRRVGEIARTDPRLEEDRAAFLARYGGEESLP